MGEFACDPICVTNVSVVSVNQHVVPKVKGILRGDAEIHCHEDEGDLPSFVKPLDVLIGSPCISLVDVEPPQLNVEGHCGEGFQAPVSGKGKFINAYTECVHILLGVTRLT